MDMSNPQTQSTDRRRPDPTVIKKYANRRLYNTATSSYVTLQDLSHMVKRDEEFQVFDAKTGEDITRSVLTQIIVEEEAKGQTMLPVNFLRQLISFYGDNLQSVLPTYLEAAMQHFARNQEELQAQMQKAFGELSPFKMFEDMARQNMAIMQQAMGQTMSLFAPFAPGAAKPDDASEVERLRAQVADLQKQLDALSKKG